MTGPAPSRLAPSPPTSATLSATQAAFIEYPSATEPSDDRALRVVSAATRVEWAGAMALLTLLELTWIRPTMAASRAAGLSPSIEHLIFAAVVDLALWAALSPVIFAILDHLPLTPAALVGSRGLRPRRIQPLRNIAGWAAVTAGAAAGEAWLVHGVWVAASQWSEAAQRTLTSPLLGLPYLIETNLQPALLLVFYYAILWRRHRTRRDEVRAVKLERSLFEAKLHAVSRQLEPHFLFNTLNAIAGLTTERPAVAEEMLVRLSALLRIAFDSTVGQTVPLRTELERSALYTDLQCMRFGDRLTVRRDIEAGTLSASVPSFLLQPLVENAIVHGFAPRRGRGTIDISARRNGGGVVLAVRDDGVGVPATHPMREGVGLRSTRARLEAMFADDYTLALEARPEGGTCATVTFPVVSGKGAGFHTPSWPDDPTTGIL